MSRRGPPRLVTCRTSRYELPFECHKCGEVIDAPPFVVRLKGKVGWSGRKRGLTRRAYYCMICAMQLHFIEDYLGVCLAETEIPMQKEALIAT